MTNRKSYNKKPITIDQQIVLMENRGLKIDDKASCKEFLTNVSYYRFSFYFKDFKEDGAAESNLFIKNTFFEKIKQIYITDQRLRNLVAEAIERIEISIRARIVNITCCDERNCQGAFWYKEKKRYARP